MSTWAEILQDAKLAGITIPLARRRYQGGWAVARHRYPQRPAQETEPTGRDPLTFSLEIPLFVPMDEGGLYPERYQELQLALQDEDTRGQVEYIDPVLGAFQVQITSFDVDEDAQRPDGAIIQVTLEERGTEEAALRFTLTDRTDARAAAETLARDVDDGLEEAGVNADQLDAAFAEAGYPRTGAELAWAPGDFFVEGVDAAFATIDAGLTQGSEVAGQIDRVRARIDRVVALDVFETASPHTLLASLYRLAEAMAEAGEQAVDDGRRVTLYTTDGQVDVTTLAARLYGDPNRADELLRLNSIADPLRIPPRTTLRIYAA